MDGIEQYSLDLANLLINKVISNYDPEARVNSKIGSSSSRNTIRLSRVSYSVLQAESLEKQGQNEADHALQEDDTLAPDVIMEQTHDSDDSDEDKDTADSRSSNQKGGSGGEIPLDQSQTLNTEPRETNQSREDTKNDDGDDDDDEVSDGDMFFYSKINKDGVLYKKCGNIFLGWKKRYAVIRNMKFYFAKDKSAYVTKKDLRCINLATQQCMITDVSENKFSIEVVGTKTKLKLKAETRDAASDWVNRLTKLINYISIRNDEKINYQLVSETKPWMMDSISQEEFLQTAQSGDVLLFQSNNFLSKMQRKLTNSDYDHVGMIYRFNGEVYYFDATGYSGVSMTSWREFLRYGWYKYYTRVVIRHLILEKPIPDLEDKISEFVIETSGAEYHLNVGKLFKRYSVAPAGEAGKDARKNEGYFCSELVAAGLKKLGLLNQRKACSQYWPVNFSSKKKLKLLEGAKLSNEMQILFEKDRY